VATIDVATVGELRGKKFDVAELSTSSMKGQSSRAAAARRAREAGSLLDTATRII